MILALIVMLAASALEPTMGADICVTARNGVTSACVNTTTGVVTSLNISATHFGVTLRNVLGGGARIQSVPIVAINASTGCITVTTTWSIDGDRRAPAGATATTVETLSAGDTSIRWHIKVDGSSPAPWSVPISTVANFSSDSVAALKLWAPWDRGAYTNFPRTFVDPLLPSDNEAHGWWDGCYRLGSPRGVSCGDYIVAPLVALLSAQPSGPMGDIGFSLILSPDDAPFDTWLYLRNSSSSLEWQRTHQRIASGTAPVSLTLDIVGHAADWRSSLRWAVDAYASFFEPVNAEVFASVAGTGSYSYYLGNLTNPALQDMAYKCNWDLSGAYQLLSSLSIPTPIHVYAVATIAIKLHCSCASLCRRCRAFFPLHGNVSPADAVAGYPVAQ